MSGSAKLVPGSYPLLSTFFGGFLIGRYRSDHNSHGPAIDERARKRVTMKTDRERVIHDTGRSGRCDRPKVRTAIRIEPCDHLIELATKAIWRNCDPNPSGQIPLGVAMNC